MSVMEWVHLKICIYMSVVSDQMSGMSSQCYIVAPLTHNLRAVLLAPCVTNQTYLPTELRICAVNGHRHPQYFDTVAWATERAYDL